MDRAPKRHKTISAPPSPTNQHLSKRPKHDSSTLPKGVEGATPEDLGVRQKGEGTRDDIYHLSHPTTLALHRSAEPSSVSSASQTGRAPAPIGLVVSRRFNGIPDGGGNWSPDRPSNIVGSRDGVSGESSTLLPNQGQVAEHSRATQSATLQLNGEAQDLCRRIEHQWSHFVMNNPTFLNLEGERTQDRLPLDMNVINSVAELQVAEKQAREMAEEKRQIEKALELLKGKANVEATLYAAARSPQPRCHPETRTELRDRIMKQLSMSPKDRPSPLLWICGALGVGKSAVAQSIAEVCKEKCWNIAVFFFSRPNKRDDPQSVIPTLALQLSETIPAYLRIVTPLILGNSTVLQGTLAFQFQTLMVDPAIALSANDSSTLSGPIVMILDGLDECNDDNDAQSEFVELVTRFAFVCKEKCLPFVWIVTSRPEPQIVNKFDIMNSTLPCHKETLSSGTLKDRNDAAKILDDGFLGALTNFPKSFTAGTQWPTEHQLSKIKDAADGHMLFASVVVEFVNNKKIGRPRAQLTACLEFLDRGVQSLKKGSPFDPLDALYRGILDFIEPSNRHVALHILGIHLLILPESGWRRSPVQGIAALLSLDQETFYASLQNLHAVLVIPRPAGAHKRSLQFYHASFGDFLKRVYRSPEHFFEEPEDQVSELDILCMFEDLRTKWIPKLLSQDQGKLSDIPWGLDDGELYKFVRNTVNEPCWKFLAGLVTRNPPGLDAVLRQIRFSNMLFSERAIRVGSREVPHEALNLLCALEGAQITSNNNHPILRSEPAYPSDSHLISTYAPQKIRSGLCMPKPFGSCLANISHNHSHRLVFVHPGADTTSSKAIKDHFDVLIQYSRDPNPEYFFLGHGENTAMIIVHRASTKLATYIDEALANIQAVHEAESSAAQSGKLWPMVNLQNLRSWPDHNNKVTFDNQLISSALMSFVSTPTRHNDAVDRLEIVIKIIKNGAPNVLEHLLRHLLSPFPSKSHFRTHIERVLTFLYQVGWGTDSGKEVWFTKGTISRSIFLNVADVESALEVLNPLILRSHPPFFNANSEEYFCLNLWYRKQISLETFLGEQARLENAIQSLRWYGAHLASSKCSLQPSECTCRKWKPELPDGIPTFGEGGIELNWARFWHTLNYLNKIPKPPDVDLERLIDGIQTFPFCHLERLHYKDPKKKYVLCFLKYVDNLGLGIIRSEANCDTDHELLQKFKGALVGCELTNSGMFVSSILSLHHPPPSKSEDLGSEFCLLGHGDNTCFVIFKNYPLPT